MEWTSGYRADIDYTHGYYRELAPNMMDLALVQMGFEPPVRQGPVRYLELGFGQGVTINIQAAASPGEYWGTDFNPGHAAHAQSLARASGARIEVLDDSFEELLRRDDLPQFDYIVLHGIWTWVSDENRKVIVDILRKRLRVGGVVYFSYNCLPGWATAMPLRHLLSSHGKETGATAGVVGKIDAALAFAAKLAELNAAYFALNPVAKTRLEGIAGQNRNYLAHEFFNDIWTPMYFSEIQKWLAEAKLSYVGGAAPLDNMDGFLFTPAQRELLAEAGTGQFRETIRDYLLNQQFRRDLYSRGARRLTPAEREARLMNLRVVLTIGVSDMLKEISVGAGKVQLNESIYRPIVEAMEKAGPASLHDLKSNLGDITNEVLIEAVMVLVASNQAHLVQEAAQIEAASAAAAQLNAELIKRALYSSDILNLASPVTGGGLAVGRFEQMFLAARATGLKTPDKWAKFAWERLAAAGQSILKDGKALETPEENLAELASQAETFDGDRLALLRRLQIAA